MRKKLAELIIVAILGIAGTATPAEREVIEVDWFTVEETEEVAAEPDYDRELLARVCMGEAGTEPFVGQVAVVATILNRCDNFGQTVSQVVYAPNQYYTGYRGTPSQEVMEAVEMAIANRDLFPRDMMYFRTKHYHSFGEPYTVIGNHYFSTKGDK